MSSPWLALARAISAQTGARCADTPAGAVGGGSIHTCHRWAGEAGWLFVKVAAHADRALLEGEADGLQRLTAAKGLRVPAVRAQGTAAGQAFLALEWIERGAATPATERALGEGLAAQHRICADRFGLDRDNHIGRTPQPNSWMESWPAFFRDRRLRPQLALAQAQGMTALLPPGERLLEAVPALLTHAPPASLLHGDLWGGNWLATTKAEPVIFDPAVYHGDREADLAMTRLFGGFGRDFHRAYEAAWPLPPGSDTRADLYNLYHVLNHANLFGGGYVSRARSLMERLLAQLRA